MIRDSFVTARQGWLDMPDSDDYADSISLFSMIKVRRNVKGFLFPGRCKSYELYDVAANVLGSIGRNEQWNDCELRMIDKLDRMSRYLLLEQRLITPGLAHGGAGRFLLRSNTSRFTCAVNDEDHITITTTFGGVNLFSANELVSKMLSSMDIDMARDSVLGYLTANPNYVGTGLQAYVVLHLPAIDALGEMAEVVAAMAADHADLSLYKVLSDQENESGSFYVVMNRTTLSLSEEEIADRVTAGAKFLVSKEFFAWNRIRNARDVDMHDRLWRAWGLLRHARKLSFSEAIEAFSLVKLGSDLGVLPAISNSEWIYMVITSQRHHMAFECQRIIEQDEEPYVRASRFREFTENRNSSLARIEYTVKDKEL